MEEASGIVVDADWVVRNRDELRIVDVREPWEFEGIGHIPDAVSIPFDEFRGTDSTDAGHLPGAERFAERMGEAGIDPEDTVVAYDDEHGVFAARFVVTALLYGHQAVHLLNGDYSAWARDHEVSTDATTVTPTSYCVEIPSDRPLIDADGVVEAARSGAILVDTRSEKEFRQGHIEGAVNIDWREFVNADTRGLRSDDELFAMLDELGITPDRRVVLYCNTARRISHTYIVLDHLGFESVEFYEGSLTDWRDRGLELVTADGGS